MVQKPKHPRSNYAVPGLYFFNAKVCQLAAGLKPGARGELEITDLIRLYLERGKYRSGQYQEPTLDPFPGAPAERRGVIDNRISRL